MLSTSDSRNLTTKLLEVDFGRVETEVFGISGLSCIKINGQGGKKRGDFRQEEWKNQSILGKNFDD